jgi:hypothetical protein
LVKDVELHTGVAYVIIERRRSLYRRILLGMVSGESRARRGNILRKVHVEFYNLYSLGRLNEGERDEQIMQHV